MIDIETLREGDIIRIIDVGDTGIPSKFNNTLQTVIYEYNTQIQFMVGVKPNDGSYGGTYGYWWFKKIRHFNIQLVKCRIKKTKKIGSQI